MRPPDWREAARRLRAEVQRCRAELAKLTRDLAEAAPLLFEHRRKSATCGGKTNCGGTPLVHVNGRWLCLWCHTRPKTKNRKKKPKDNQ